MSMRNKIVSHKNRKTPSYDLVQVEGAIHEPTSRYRVLFTDKDGPFTSMGAARSKTEAKLSAARALIDKLTGIQLPKAQAAAPAGPTTVADNANAAGSGEDTADKIVGNPIGWLQEMCVSRTWPPPKYETETESGLQHERLFTIACTILNFREVGKGTSKKIAKRSSAHKMWTRLKDASIDNDQIVEAIGTDWWDIKVQKLFTAHSNKVSSLQKTVKNSTGEKLIKLHKTCLKDPKIDHVKLLGEIAEENQFVVTYVDIEEKTFNDKYQCLVQLSNLPVGVCHGSGDIRVDAQKMAAQNALEYLKIMTKK